MFFLHLPALTHPSDVDVLFLHIWRCTALSSLVFVRGEMKEMRKKIRFLLSLRSSFLVVLLLLPICCFIHIGLGRVYERRKNSNFDQRSLSRKNEQRAWEAYMHRFIYSSREYQLNRRVCKDKNMWKSRRCEPKLNLKKSRQMSRISSIITPHTTHGWGADRKIFTFISKSIELVWDFHSYL